MGYLYHRKLKSGERSSMFWCKYYQNGRPRRESTGTALEREARDFLKKREGAIAEGRPIPVRQRCGQTPTRRDVAMIATIRV